MNDQTPDTAPPPDEGPRRPQSSESSATPGAIFGPYRLLDRVGEGGMGEVWKAEQSSPIRRTVALKLLKAGMDSREVLARFETERQALALMDHPCIAKVFDAGTTPQGRPYFAMEYVQGAPIDEYCDKRRLSTRDRLELFQKVCQGVQHAHQKAVLHRDLKPTNVLVSDVDGRPHPTIIDFGVAKATTRKLTENTMHTSIGQLIGTPEYMSPEQAELTKEDVDTRADVYSLGVILYELLVGALPFEHQDLRRAGLEGILKILREQDPQRPSTRLSTLGERSTRIAQCRRTEARRLSGQLRGDLDWIVMRALEKDRNRRYGSPAEFAQDIQRHLQDEPVLAGPPTVLYRASKFVRRNRAGVAIASVVVLALATLAVTSTLQAESVARERDRAEAESAKAAAMNEFLSETLASADPWAGSGRDATVVAALNAAVEQIDSAFEGQPEVEASMRAVLGQTYLGLGKLDLAAIQIERAVQMRLDQGGADAHDFGQLRMIEARLRQSTTEYGRAVESAAESARIFRRGAEAGPDDLLSAYQIQTRNLLYGQRYAEADSVLELCDVVAGGLKGERAVLSAENLSLRADLYKERDGNAAAADSLSRLAYERARSIDPDNATVPVYLNNAAQYRSESGDFEGALADFDVALALYEKRFGTDHPEYATCLENRGGVLYRLGRADETFAALEQVHDIRSRNLGPSHIDVVRTGLNMGTVALITGEFQRALEIFQELKPVLIVARGTDHPDVLTVLRNEGNTLRALDRNDEALLVLAEALTISERMYGDAHALTARTRADYGVSLERSGRFADAERQFVAAFDVNIAELGAEHPRTRKGAQLLVSLYERLGRADDAERYRAYAGE